MKPRSTALPPSLLCGVDEVGRGPLAGPVVTAAVILDPDNPIEGLADSKKLTEKRREFLYDEIRDKARWAAGIDIMLICDPRDRAPPTKQQDLDDRERRLGRRCGQL